MLRISHLNINSLRYKCQTIREFIHSVKPQVVCISETWLDPNYKSDGLQIEDYLFVRNDRGIRNSVSCRREFIQGGGIAVYLHSSLSYKLLYASAIKCLSDTEYMILEVFSRKSADTSRFLLAVVYRRPAGVMLSEFFIKLENYMQTFKNIIIVGDFNINMLQTSFESAHLSTLVQERALQFIPFGATHFGHGQPSAIDLAIVDSFSKVKSFFISECPIAAGHHAITFDYKVQVPKFEPRKVTYRDFKRCELNALTNEIEQKLSNVLNLQDNTCDVSEIVDTFNLQIISSLDRHAPQVTRTIVKPFAAWLTPELKQRCKERDKLYKKASRKKCGKLLAAFRNERRDLKILLNLARDKYLRDKITPIKDRSLIWHVLEQEGLTSQKSELATKFFSATDLNHHFCSVARSHQPCSTERMEEIINETSILVTTEFSFSSVSQTQVLEAFNELSNKSSGQSPDGLSSKHLGKVFDSILPFVTYIFNLIIHSSKYPQSWKRAFIIPLNKIPQPLSLSDTRPIANLAHLAKVFDKLLTGQILNYLEKNNLLVPLQFGFRSDHSTQSALLHLTDRIRDGIENGLVTIAVQFDFRKAFDSICHQSLLIELCALGFSPNALRLIHSYITGRSQAVIDEDRCPTDFEDIFSG